MRGSHGDSSDRVIRETLYPERLGLVGAKTHHEMFNKAQCGSLCNEAHWLTKWRICIAYQFSFRTHCPCAGLSRAHTVLEASTQFLLLDISVI